MLGDLWPQGVSKVCFSESVQIQNTELYYSVQHLQIDKYKALIKKSKLTCTQAVGRKNSIQEMLERKSDSWFLLPEKLLLILLYIDNLNRTTLHVPILNSLLYFTFKSNSWFYSLTTINQQTGIYPN